MSDHEPRRYETHDTDQQRVELLVSSAPNGDWYLSIVPTGHKFARLATDERAEVRVTTSGERREHTHVAAAVAALYDALGGEPKQSISRTMAERGVTSAALVQAFGAVAEEIEKTRGEEDHDTTEDALLLIEDWLLGEGCGSEVDQLRAIAATATQALAKLLTKPAIPMPGPAAGPKGT